LDRFVLTMHTSVLKQAADRSNAQAALAHRTSTERLVYRDHPRNGQAKRERAGGCARRLVVVQGISDER
jgi:hypothetical protein